MKMFKNGMWVQRRVVFKFKIQVKKVRKKSLYMRDCASAEIAVQQADTVRGWTGRRGQRRRSRPELLTLVQHRVSVKQRQKKVQTGGERRLKGKKDNTQENLVQTQHNTKEQLHQRRGGTEDGDRLRSRDEASCCLGPCVPGIQLTPQMALIWQIKINNNWPSLAKTPWTHQLFVTAAVQPRWESPNDETHWTPECLVLPCTTPGRPTSPPPVFLSTPVSQPSPLGRPDLRTPAAPGGDLAAPDGPP